MDFRNEPGTLAEAQELQGELMTVPFSRLFMAIYYAQRTHSPAVYEWLIRHDFTRDLTSLLFAMGVRSLSDAFAHELIGGWLSNPGKALMVLPEQCGQLIAGFGREE